MKKIPGLFVRDMAGDPRRVLCQVTPGCEWVLGGDGDATRKRDGTAAMVRSPVTELDSSGGEIINLFKRYDCKRGKVPPPGAIPCQDPDPITGHWPHWIRVRKDNPEDRWFMEARARWPREAGTYEFCGPKIGTNHERLTEHQFFRHGGERLHLHVPMFSVVEAFDYLRTFFDANAMEGIVFHHADGRMAKIRRPDFGLPWPVLFPVPTAGEA